MTKSEKMYMSLMENFPAPGGGGAHTAFFKAGALGYKAKVPEKKIVDDVLEALPEGGRVVPDEEIITGVAKGFATAMYADLGGGNTEVAVKSQIPRDSFSRLATAGAGATITDIMARSPVPLDFPEGEAGWRTLEKLYRPDEHLYIGGPRDSGEIGKTVRSVKDWIVALKKKTPLDIVSSYNFIVVNPITGRPSPTKLNPEKMSLRSDSAIASWRYAVVEFDSVPIESQLAFWAVVKLPVAALVMSGGKSIHGWVQVDCDDVHDWTRGIEEDLFPGFLLPLGVDGSCKNESRLSRLPGQTRANNGAMQKLIYLAPGGKAVSK